MPLNNACTTVRKHSLHFLLLVSQFGSVPYSAIIVVTKRLMDMRKEAWPWASSNRNTRRVPRSLEVKVWAWTGFAEPESLHYSSYRVFCQYANSRSRKTNVLTCSHQFIFLFAGVGYHPTLALLAFDSQPNMNLLSFQQKWYGTSPLQGGYQSKYLLSSMRSNFSVRMGNGALANGSFATLSSHTTHAHMRFSLLCCLRSPPAANCILTGMIAPVFAVHFPVLA